MTRRQRQARIVAGEYAVLEHVVDALDEIIPDERVDHMTERLREQPAREISVCLHALVDDRDVPDREPAERIVDANAPSLRQIDRIREPRRAAPVRRQRRAVEAAHQP